jgi:hypothetical protein
MAGSLPPLSYTQGTAKNESAGSPDLVGRPALTQNHLLRQFFLPSFISSYPLADSPELTGS